MRKLAIATALSLLVTPVMAGDYYRHDHYHYNRGGGGNWVAPLVGGMILGGIIGNMNQRPYYTDIEPNPYDQPVCHRVFAGYDYYGRPHFRVICD